MRKLLALLRLPLSSGLAEPRHAAGPKPRALLTEAEWIRLRAPVRQRDLALSEAAHAWFQRLAPESQPHNLCARYPRIANRLALLWRDPGLVDHELDDLTAPSRPGRRGFPPEVFGELLALRVRNDARIYGCEDSDLEAEDAGGV